MNTFQVDVTPKEKGVESLDQLEIILRQARAKLFDYPEQIIQTPYHLLVQSVEHSLSLTFAMKEVLKGRL